MLSVRDLETARPAGRYEETVVRSRPTFIFLLIGFTLAWAGIDPAEADEPGHLYLVDSQFTPPVTRIYEVDLSSAVLTLKADLGQAYTPILGMAASNATTLYLAATDTTPLNACQGARSCQLLKAVLDPDSTTPAQLQLIGTITAGGSVVPEITGLTFRQDGQLYGISQTTFSLYRIDTTTAEATLVGAAGLELHGGDVTFDDQDRMLAWTNIGAGSGFYLMNPSTGLATAFEIYPGLDLAGMCALKHGMTVYGASAGTDRLYAFNLMGGNNGGVLMTLSGARFDHARGDLDSPYCDDDAACDDQDLCTADACSPGGCLHDPVPGCCVADSECNDAAACTQDLCVDHQCVHPPVPTQDANPCTQDVCDPQLGVLHLPIAQCCVSDAGCDDFNGCTRDTCELNQCVHERLETCGGPGGTVRRQDRGGGN